MSYAGRPHRGHTSAPPIGILGASLVHWIRFDLRQVSLAADRISQARDRLSLRRNTRIADDRPDLIRRGNTAQLQE